jgi:hypothetical protein
MTPRRRRGKAQPGDGLLPGPQDCMRARGTGRVCDTCGVVPPVLHVPTRQAGAFCAECCPCCGAGARLSRDLKTRAAEGRVTRCRGGGS